MSSRPTIAIVGRPNVGKSTLFNRLTGAAPGARLRHARPHPRPARGRGGDRRPARSPSSTPPASRKRAPGSIAARMRAQSEAAISVRRPHPVRHRCARRRDAGRQGVRPGGARLGPAIDPGRQQVRGPARRRRRSTRCSSWASASPSPSRPSMAKASAICSDDIAQALGLERRSRGARTTASRRGAAARGSCAGRPIRVAIVGRPNAGKSTLVNALLGEERMITGPEPGLTRDAIATELDWNGRADPPLRHRGPQAQGAHHRAGREARRQRCASARSASPRSWCC